MKTRNLMLTTVLTASVIGLFAMVLSSGLMPLKATAAGVFANHGHGSHGGRHGHHCGPLDDRTARLATAYVTISLDLNDTQQATLEPVINIAQQIHDTATTLCDHDHITTAPAALVELERVLTETTTAMAELRGAFDAFYATLTVEQQAELNSWLDHGHGA